MRKFIYPALALCLLGLTACGPDIVYAEQRDLPRGWSYADSLAFPFTIADTSAAYDLEVTLDHGTDFPYQNTYVLLHTTFPDGHRTTSRVNLQLAGDFGVWKGDCSATSCTYLTPIALGTRFREAGTYVLTVEQNSREEVIGAVTGVGVRVLRADGN